MLCGFNNDLYVKKQSEEILSRIEKAGDRLYLEFGGKLFDDCHAARVLPGFDVNAKVKLLERLKDKAEIIIAISAKDLERNKIRADHGIGYGADVLRLIDKLRELKIQINSVVITQYSDQPAADTYRTKLQRRGEKVYIHTRTKGYPTNIDVILSDEGYGVNPYVKVTKPLVVITAPGPCSGKLATCLCQLYHESKMNIKSAYAKFETFPVCNLPLKHPVNVAYEAATADLKDVNMIDHFHLEAYGKTAVNYNRDIEVFPVVRSILRRISDNLVYNSPTDMGVNMVGCAITDDELICHAAKMEVIRRYYKACCDYAQGLTDAQPFEKIELLISDLGITLDYRKVCEVAREESKKLRIKIVAIQLPDGQIVCGKDKNLLSAASGAVLNAVKTLAGISDDIDVIAPSAIEPILKMKKNNLSDNASNLSLSETLIALSMSAATFKIAENALAQLDKLKGAEAHCSCIMNETDEKYMRKLGVNITSEPVFNNNNLYNE